MGALVDLLGALRGTIVVAARRASPRTVVAAGVGAVLVAAASVYAVTSDAPTGSSSDAAGDGAQANGGRTAPPESAAEGDHGGGLPLISGMSADPTAPRADARGGDDAASSGGAVSADAPPLPGAEPVGGPEPMTTTTPTTGEPPSTSTTSTTAPMLPGQLGGIGDLIGGLLAVLTLV